MREIELEENDFRTGLTERERHRTLEAQVQIVADAKQAEELIAAAPAPIKKTSKNPKGAGPKPKGKATKSEIAKAIGVSETALINAEKRVAVGTGFLRGLGLWLVLRHDPSKVWERFPAP